MELPDAPLLRVQLRSLLSHNAGRYFFAMLALALDDLANVNRDNETTNRHYSDLANTVRQVARDRFS